MPYLDGFVGIFADKQAVRVEAIRSDRAAMEFRGLPPSASDELQRELGDKVKVQTSDWNCGNVVTPNQKSKPFDDVRVRRALLLADRSVERRAGAVEDRQRAHRGRHRLPRLAAGGDQGGAAEDGRLLARHREVARRGPASAEGSRRRRGCSFELLNRNVDQPYKYVGTWLVDEWSKIGVKATQKRRSRPARGSQAMRAGDFDVVVEANCQSVVNPVLDTQQVPAAREVYRRTTAATTIRKLIELYEKMLSETDFDKQRALMRAVRDAHPRHRGARVPDAVVVPHRSPSGPTCKGWKISPSHYLNQDLSNIWLRQVGRPERRAEAGDVSLHHQARCCW